MFITSILFIIYLRLFFGFWVGMLCGPGCSGIDDLNSLSFYLSSQCLDYGVCGDICITHNWKLYLIIFQEIKA